jgi:capsular exopolysaccharide synthesis family protein
VITSAGPKEGKSTTAANLAVAFAQQGQRVVLVDCDLRRPRVHTLFDVSQNPGLTNLLLGDATLDQVVRPTRVPGLSVITSGPLPPNPVELLGSQQMRDVLERIESDLVVLDTPPMLVASDAAVLARAADGVLMVVRAGTTQRGALQESAQQLASIGARLVGTVLNDPDAEVAKYASYYQYYFNNYYEHAES